MKLLASLHLLISAALVEVVYESRYDKMYNMYLEV